MADPNATRYKHLGLHRLREYVTMTLEFRIPISPTAGFYSEVRLFAVSLAWLGPPYSTARILVSVGDCADLDRVRGENKWAARYPVEWRNVPHDLFRELRYIATGNDRYSEPARADVVILCDADTCPVARFDDLLTMLSGEPKVAGLQAHFAPFAGSAAECEAKWEKLFAGAGLAGHPLTRRYSMDSMGAMGRAPPYFNYGFVALNRAAFEAVSPLALGYVRQAVTLVGDSFHTLGFSDQAGLTLAIAAAGVPTLPLGHAYNCANDDLVFTTGIASEDEIKVIHYLRDDEFDRRTFLADPVAFRVFLAIPKRNRVSERLRRHVTSLVAELGIGT
jgi:hypothetical protein